MLSRLMLTTIMHIAPPGPHMPAPQVPSTTSAGQPFEQTSTLSGVLAHSSVQLSTSSPSESS